MKERAKERIEKLGSELFGTNDSEQTIEAFKDLFEKLGSPVRCQDSGIDPSSKMEILEFMNKNSASGLNFKLSDDDRKEILSFILRLFG